MRAGWQIRKAMAAAGVAVAVAAMVGACESSVRTPSSTPSSPASSPAPSASPGGSTGCTADRVLAEVRSKLAGQTFEAHYLTIGGELTLSVWYADPGLDPSATDATLADNNRKALERGVRLSYDLVSTLPCVASVFANVNPMIVDSRYQNWYINFIPSQALAALHDPTLDELAAAVRESANGPGGRRAAPKPHTPGGSCTWPEARRAIDPILTGKSAALPPSEAGNTVGYLIIGGSLVPETRWSGTVRDDVGVEVQWTVPAASPESDSEILGRLGRLAESLSCVSPHLDSLEAFIVDPSGRLVAYGRVPGALVQAHAAPLPAALVKIERYSVP